MPSFIVPSTAFLTLVLAAGLAGQRALAVNDWSVPCTQGKCSWDVPAESGTAGSVQIWGSVSAISDITPATGWQITTKCDPSSSKQDIQLMCKDNNPDCEHLFQGNAGAKDTIVRLPESCGPMPFARVAQHQVLQSNLGTRGNDSKSTVHHLTLDTDFAAAGPSGGEVHFSVQGQNRRDDLNAVNRRSHRRLRSLARSQNHVYRQDDGNSTADGVQGGLALPTFNRTLSANPAVVNFSGQKNLFKDGSVSIDIDSNFQVSVLIKLAATGRIVPPSVNQFGLTFGLEGNADAKLSFSGDISKQVSSGNITLFQGGFTGLSIPNVFEIGPQITVVGSIDGKFATKNVNAAVEVNYDLGGASFVFPPQDGSNTNGLTPSSKQVSFSADPDVGATLDATAHLIPEVSIGVNALSGSASASVFLNLDAALGLQGSVSATNPQPCLSGNADINVGVGAQGSFFGLFDASTGKPLFDKNFPLFQKCFGQKANSTTSTTQASATGTTATDSASQTSKAKATATDSAFRTSAPDATATDSPSKPGPGVVNPIPLNPASPPKGGGNDTPPDSNSQTNAAGATVTDSASPTVVVNANTTDSASQTSAAGATATDASSQTSGAGATATDSASPTVVVNANTTDSASQTSTANVTATDASSQTSGADATATDSASQTVVVNTTTTDSASQTSTADATATDASSQTSGADATATDSASQTIVANATTTDSASQTSATNFTATDSASQTSTADATATDSSPQTGGANATATDSASQTSAANATSTDSTSQTSGADATATDSASQTSGAKAAATDSNSQADATAASESKRHYDAPRAVRHSPRFRRSYYLAKRDLSHL